MQTNYKRRRFLKQSLVLAGLGSVALPAAGQSNSRGKVSRKPGFRIQIGLNAYSFNQAMRDGAMTLFDVIDYCVDQEIYALDATGYYFPGYPAVPPDEYLYSLKKHAFLNGVDVSGTGVRNDFTLVDAVKRQAEVQLVKNWIEVGAKLGAAVIRIFAGAKVPDGHSFDQALEWMIPHFKECAAYGARHGVVVGLQNHNDFVKTAAETIRIVEAVNSEWFGVILDVGSLRQKDPYEEIERLLPYAVSWQFKENVWYGNKEVPIDLNRMKTIIGKGGYRGFLPLETLGPGDHKDKVAKFRQQVRDVFAV